MPVNSRFAPAFYAEGTQESDAPSLNRTLPDTSVRFYFGFWGMGWGLWDGYSRVSGHLLGFSGHLQLVWGRLLGISGHIRSIASDFGSPREFFRSPPPHSGSPTQNLSSHRAAAQPHFSKFFPEKSCTFTQYDVGYKTTIIFRQFHNLSREVEGLAL